MDAKTTKKVMQDNLNKLWELHKRVGGSPGHLIRAVAEEITNKDGIIADQAEIIVESRRAARKIARTYNLRHNLFRQCFKHLDIKYLSASGCPKCVYEENRNVRNKELNPRREDTS